MDGINSPRRTPSQVPLQDKTPSTAPAADTATDKPVSKSAWNNIESWFEVTLGRRKGGSRQAGQLLDIIKSTTVVAGSLTGKVPDIAGKSLEDIHLGNVSSDNRPEGLLKSAVAKNRVNPERATTTEGSGVSKTTEELAALLDNAEKTLSTLDKKTATLNKVVNQLQTEYERLTTVKPQWRDPFQRPRLEAADRYHANSVVKPRLEKAQQLLADHIKSARSEKKPLSDRFSVI